MAVKQVDGVLGNNGNSGAPGAPWLDFTNVRTQSWAAGDILEYATGSNYDISGTTVNLTLPGTSALPFVMRSFGSGARPELRGGGVSVFQLNATFLRMEDLIINVQGGNGTTGIIANPMTDCDFLRVDITGYGASGIGNRGEGIRAGASSPRNKLRDCTIYSGYGPGVHQSSSGGWNYEDVRFDGLAGNTADAVLPYGIWIDGAALATYVRRSSFKNMTVAGGACAKGGTNLYLFGNFFHNCTTFAIDTLGSGAGVVACNNVIVTSHNSAVWGGGIYCINGATVTALNNMVFNRSDTVQDPEQASYAVGGWGIFLNNVSIVEGATGLHFYAMATINPFSFIDYNAYQGDDAAPAHGGSGSGRWRQGTSYRRANIVQSSQPPWRDAGVFDANGFAVSSLSMPVALPQTVRDFIPQQDSPLWGRGANLWDFYNALAAQDSPVETDFYGRRRPRLAGGAWDIGPFMRPRLGAGRASEIVVGLT